MPNCHDKRVAVLALAVPALLSLALGACAGADGQISDAERPDEPITRLEVDDVQQQVRITDYIWPGGTLPVCFEPQFAGDELPANDANASYAEQVARIQTVLENGWMNIPNTSITFTGFGRCSNRVLGSLKNTIRFVIERPFCANFITRNCNSTNTYSPFDCGTAGSNKDHEMDITVCRSVYGRTGSPQWDGAVLHEVGHVLGLNHEQDRPDAPATATAADNYDISIAGAPLYGCNFSKTAGTPGEILASVYDPLSIMSSTYCNSHELLSAGDELAAEMLYPNGVRSMRIVGSKAFALGVGWVVNDKGSLISDWTERGASLAAFASNNSRWTVNNATSNVPSTELPVANLPDGLSVVSGSFVDFRGLTHTLNSVAIAKDRKRHTAILTRLL